MARDNESKGVDRVIEMSEDKEISTEEAVDEVKRYLEAGKEYLEDSEKVIDVCTNPIEMWVHTNYLDTDVINDLITLLDFELRWVHSPEPGGGGFDCVEEHGKCVEFNLVIPSDWEPVPLEAWPPKHHPEFVHERNKLFDASLQRGEELMEVPSPGSDEALNQGCKCPVMDNAHGEGRLGGGEEYIYTVGCPVHPSEEEEV